MAKTGALLAVLLVVGSVISPADAVSVEEAAVTVEVGMTDRLTFTPDTVRVDAGTTVRFENTSVLVHTVTADRAEATLEGSVRLPDGAEPFDSGDLSPGESFSHVFEVPGVYAYFCIPHEGAGMVGTVVVD